MRFFQGLLAGLFLTALASVVMVPAAAAETAKERYEVFVQKGLSALDDGDTEIAIDNLEEAEKIEPKKLDVLFYLGQAYWNSGDINQGTAYFQKVYELSPDSEFGKVAKKYLDLLTKKEAKRYFIDVFSGFQYDTNVPEKPNTTAIAAIKEKVDWSWLFYLKGAYSHPVADGLTLNASYDFYQSAHFNFSDFDVNDNNLKLYATYVKGPLVGFLAYNFRYTFLGGDSFESINGVSPKLRYIAGSKVTVEAYYTFEDRNFYTNRLRDSLNHKYSLDVYYYFLDKQGSARLGYYHDIENAFGRQWDYDGYGLLWGITVPLPWEMRVSANGEYQYRRYDKGLSIVHADIRNRKNNNTSYTLSVSKQFDKHFGVLASYTDIQDVSSLEEFDYDRQIVSLLFTAKF